MPNPSAKQPHRLLLVADDLTGACDTAVAFSHRGVSARVLTAPAQLRFDQAEVCAVVTGTRDCAAEEAVARIEQLARHPDLGSFDEIFKKVDSVFRGNTAVEVDAALQHFSYDLAVIAPAYPRMGRVSRGGTIMVSDIHGEHQVEAFRSLRQVGAEPHLLPEGNSPEYIAEAMLHVAGSGSRSVWCDAQQDADLHACVVAAQRLQMRVLWIGSGGLAHALASQIPQGERKPPSCLAGRVLLFVGTDHAVSQTQVERLLAQDRAQVFAAGSPQPPLHADTEAILIPVRWDGTTPQQLASAVEKIGPESVSCLFMTGGDTAAMVCEAFGIQALDLQAECEPGIPQATVVGGPFSGRPAVLKSGGFGSSGCMLDIVDRFSGKKEVSVWQQRCRPETSHV